MKTGMSVLLPALLLASPLASGAGDNSAAVLAPPGMDVLAWPRMTSTSFGCLMEKQLSHRDAHFNCGLHGYRNRGDACGNPDVYYEGPAFPADRARAVHPLASAVELSWEHGDLQAVTITLKGIWPEAQVRTAFRLPRASGDHLSAAELDAHAWPANIMDTDVQYPSKDETAVTLTGFDHMGAADVGCE